MLRDESARHLHAVSREPTSAVPPQPPSFPVLYRFLRGACRPIVNSLFSLRAEGTEHLPASGPFILAANHHNYLDGVVLGVARAFSAPMRPW